jgi:hypothetical protein
VIKEEEEGEEEGDRLLLNFKWTGYATRARKRLAF